MDIKTLTATIPPGRVQVFKQLDRVLKQIDDEASELRLAQQAEMEAVKMKLELAVQGVEKKVALLNLLQEKCDMIKPVLQAILIEYGDELSADKVKKIEDFLNFSLPDQDQSLRDRLYAALSLDELKRMFGIGQTGDEEDVVEEEEEEEEPDEEPEEETDPLDVELGEGEFELDTEIDVSKEIEHWGAPVHPETKNTVVLARDPNDQDNLIPIAYKFNIRYDNLANDVMPSYHIDFDDSYKPTIIRFHSGKPYQDVAYRISDRPWYVNEELGFVNDFDKETGIYMLHFNLKK